jgi:hypothetical protein
LSKQYTWQDDTVAAASAAKSGERNNALPVKAEVFRNSRLVSFIEIIKN